MKKEEFTRETFIEAIKIFHSIAYPGKEFPQGVYAKILSQIESCDTLSQLLGLFQKFNPNLNIYDWGKKIRITIGCEKYPFLKLVLQESPIKGEYGFLVDRHSEFLGNKESMSFSKEIELKQYLSDIKETIEDELYEKHLPSYKYLIKKYIEKNKTLSLGESNRETILLAEDEEDVHNLYKMELEILGFTVCSAYSGEEAITLTDEAEFSCIVMDLMMPNVSGLDVLKEIGREQKIIVLSALGDENTKKTCKELGAFAYLEKPADQEELESTVSKVKHGQKLI